MRTIPTRQYLVNACIIEDRSAVGKLVHVPGKCMAKSNP